KYERSGPELIEAFVAGYEPSCDMAALAGRDHYEAGFHASAALCSFGAAIAAGRLMKLDDGQLAQAMGIAATMTAGLKAVFGSMAKSVQVGRTRANGVLAAEMARRGRTSANAVIEDRQGFLATHLPAGSSCVPLTSGPQ